MSVACMYRYGMVVLGGKYVKYTYYAINYAAYHGSPLTSPRKAYPLDDDVDSRTRATCLQIEDIFYKLMPRRFSHS